MVSIQTLYNDLLTLIKQNFYDKGEIDANKQDKLVSGTNIKTVNNNSLLGAGNISISSSGTVDSALSTTSTNPVENQAITNEINSLSTSITNIYEASGTFITNNCFTYRTNLGNFRRVGKVVQFEMGDNVKATNTTTRGATYPYLTIPNGFKPVQNMYMQNMYWLNNEKEHQITFIAQTNGSLVARVWWTQSTQQDVGLMIGATWITNDTTPSQ